MFMSFSKNKFTDAFVAKLGNRCFCWFPSAMFKGLILVSTSMAPPFKSL